MNVQIISAINREDGVVKSATCANFSAELVQVYKNDLVINVASKHCAPSVGAIIGRSVCPSSSLI